MYVGKKREFKDVHFQLEAHCSRTNSLGLKLPNVPDISLLKGAMLHFFNVGFSF